MKRQLFTKEQQELLSQNPYVFSVSPARIALTKEFKEEFLAAYNAGELPRKILADHGLDPQLLGERRVGNMVQNIRNEFAKYGCFQEGFGPRKALSDEESEIALENLSDREQIKLLRHEVNFLKQEMEFVKKISSLRNCQR